MSKLKKRGLFQQQSEALIQQNEGQNGKQIEHVAFRDQIDGVLPHKELKKDIIIQVILTFSIIAVFSVLYLTNAKSDWIDDTSNKLLRYLVKDF